MKSMVDRFFAKVNKFGPNGCWIWTAYRMERSGYGVFGVDNKKTELAHRFAYTLKNGTFDKSLCVLHKCDNPPCVNPDHLFLGTQADNMRDCAEKGRIKNPVAEKNAAKTHCPKGHEYGTDGFYKSNGWRQCKICFREHSKNYRMNNAKKIKEKENTPERRERARLSMQRLRDRRKGMGPG